MDAAKPLTPNLSKWSRPNLPEQAPGTDSSSKYQPNLSKWARPTEVPRASILKALDRTSPLPRRSRPLNFRNGEQPKETSGKWIPKFPSTNDSQALKRPPKHTASKLDRDGAPHLSRPKSAEHNSSNGYPVATSSDRQLQNDLGEGPSHKPELTDYDDYTDVLDVQVDNEGPDSDIRARRPAREGIKERGSVVERLKTGGNVQIPRHPRINSGKSAANRKAKRAKAAAKLVNLDIFIPSIISVGNLAQLLGIRLGTLLNILYIVIVLRIVL